MSALFAQLISPLTWFAMAAALLYVLAGAYVHALLLVARLPSIGKVALSVLLWLTFSVIAVAPLFGWLEIARIHFPGALESPFLVWPLPCFGLCFVALYRPLRRRLPQLQAAGLFRQ